MRDADPAPRVIPRNPEAVPPLKAKHVRVLQNMLNQDQRWLLRAVGGWTMRDCLIGPDGVAHLMQSMYCGSGPKFDGAPAWLHRGFECGRGRIDLLDRALGFERAEEPEPVGQLELFTIGAIA